MQPKKIDLSKRYRTRDGREVTVLTISANCAYPVVALVRDTKTRQEHPESFTAYGFYNTMSPSMSHLDLIEVPKFHFDWGYLGISWAHWIARDDTGTWFAYASEPQIGGKMWHAHDDFAIEIPSPLCPVLDIPMEWNDTLLERIDSPVQH